MDQNGYLNIEPEPLASKRLGFNLIGIDQDKYIMLNINFLDSPKFSLQS